jgi:hypothetical protein
MKIDFLFQKKKKDNNSEPNLRHLEQNSDEKEFNQFDRFFFPCSDPP